MQRTVEDHQRIGVEQRAVRGDHAREAGRADLLLAVQNHLDAHRRRLALRRQHVHRRQEHEDRSLVVGGRSGEDTQIRIERLREELLAIDFAPSSVRLALLHHRLEGALLRPLFRDNGLSIEVDIEENRLYAGRGGVGLGQDQRPAGRIVQESG